MNYIEFNPSLLSEVSVYSGCKNIKARVGYLKKAIVWGLNIQPRSLLNGQ